MCDGIIFINLKCILSEISHNYTTYRGLFLCFLLVTKVIHNLLRTFWKVPEEKKKFTHSFTLKTEIQSLRYPSPPFFLCTDFLKISLGLYSAFYFLPRAELLEQGPGRRGRRQLPQLSRAPPTPGGRLEASDPRMFCVSGGGTVDTNFSLAS